MPGLLLETLVPLRYGRQSRISGRGRDLPRLPGDLWRASTHHPAWPRGPGLRPLRHDGARGDLALPRALLGRDRTLPRSPDPAERSGHPGGHPGRPAPGQASRCGGNRGWGNRAGTAGLVSNTRCETEPRKFCATRKFFAGCKKKAYKASFSYIRRISYMATEIYTLTSAS